MSLDIYLRRDIANVVRGALVVGDAPASLLRDGVQPLDAYELGYAKALVVLALAFGVVPDGTTPDRVLEALRRLPQESG